MIAKIFNKKNIRKSCVLLVFKMLFILSACGSNTPTPNNETLYDYASNSVPTYQVRCPKNENELASFASPVTSSLTSSINSKTFTDTYYQLQWQLHDSYLSIEKVWLNQILKGKCFGNGINIAIVDTAVDTRHEDLKANIDVAGSYDFTGGGAGKVSVPSRSEHGTGVAGIIGAEMNGYGVIGIAPKSRLRVYNLLEKPPSIENKIIAMTKGIKNTAHKVDISNNSWGALDNKATLYRVNSLWIDAVDEGTAEGRDGKGINYVWAAGNGGQACTNRLTEFCDNNINYDGLTNYRKVIAVGALAKDRRKLQTSEPGANLLVMAYGENIYTTALTPTNLRNVERTHGPDYRYTNYFGQTSGAAPMVSGVVALILENNPELGWRDVRRILAVTADKVHSEDPDWVRNGSGLWVNHNYGYGAVNAARAIAQSQTWRNLPAEKRFEASQTYPAGNLLDTSFSTYPVTVENSGISDIESVEIILNSHQTHSNWADLDIELISPQGTGSVLTVAHTCASCTEQKIDGFRFTSVRLTGENPNGKWILKARDRYPNHYQGDIDQVILRIYGT